MLQQRERVGIAQTAIPIIKRMRRETVDFGFDVDKNVAIRIIVKPGLWLKPDKLQKLQCDLQSVISETIPAGLDYGIACGDKWCLDHAVVSILYDRNSKRPIGFNAFCLLDVNFRDKPVEVLHLGLVVVKPEFQASGYSWVLCGLPCLLLFLRNGGRSIWVSNVSQIPAVLGSVVKAFDNVYPSYQPNSQRTFDHVIIAREVMRQYRFVFGVGEEAEFDEFSFVIRNSYTGGSQSLKKTFEATTKSSDDYINKWCSSNLDYERGDDVLQIGVVNFSVIMGYLLRAVPKESILYLLYRMTFVVWGRIFFLAVQWLSPAKPFGDLRPRR